MAEWRSHFFPFTKRSRYRPLWSGDEIALLEDDGDRRRFTSSICYYRSGGCESWRHLPRKGSEQGLSGQKIYLYSIRKKTGVE